MSSKHLSNHPNWGLCTDTHGTKHCPRLELLNLILDNIYNGVMITDAEGYVTHFNAPYGAFLGVNPREQIGKHCY